MVANGDQTRGRSSGASLAPVAPSNGILKAPEWSPASPSADEAAEMVSGDAEYRGGCDQIMQNELDAAHALAEFAQLALMANENPGDRRRGGEGKWGGRGRRSGKQRLRRTGIWRNSFGGSEKGSSLRDVQAEKEERRLRRIQANRESARQTIRRRQAHREELVKKAADLSLENEMMKQEIGLATQEYLSLVDTNKRLREQVAEVDTNDCPSQDMKEAALEDGTCKTGHLMSSPIALPLLDYNGMAFAQFAWPSIMQPLDSAGPQAVCCELNPLTACTSNLPNGRWIFGEQNRLRTQLLVLAFPLVYSINEQTCQTFPSTSLSSSGSDGCPNNCLHETDLTLKLTRDAGSKSLHGETQLYSSTMDATKKEKKGDELTESSSGISMEGGSGISRFCPKTLALVPSLRTSEPSTLNQDLVLSDSDSRNHVSSVAPPPQPSGKVLDKHLYHNKRFSDVTTATEAWKRRKELTKYKKLHGRQFRLHC